ncbi:hypothetical protein RDI58_009296 [Solanum bulbocastanum]|uniref:Uncharacterized protein n=1 Tax=Solanum bulbocastanum TaxID=147425 RepID=A0AAN8U248_SOLBU
MDVVEEYADHCVPIWLHYLSQLRQTHVRFLSILLLFIYVSCCFDIDVHSGSSLGAGISVYDFNEDVELMMKLANRAIQEYNERMTVKFRNLTLVTPIEIFQIRADKSCRDGGEKVIYCCQPKGETVVGLATCDLCLRKLRREAYKGEKEHASEEV